MTTQAQNKISFIDGRRFEGHDPEDQRFALIGGGLYVYDHSGSTPYDTDDGPLRVLSATVVYLNGNPTVSLRVQVEDQDQKSRAMVGVWAVPLLMEQGIQVKVSAEMRALVNILAPLAGAPRTVTVTIPVKVPNDIHTASVASAARFAAAEMVGYLNTNYGTECVDVDMHAITVQDD